MLDPVKRRANRQRMYWKPRIALLHVFLVTLWYHPTFIDDYKIARHAKRIAGQAIAAQKRRLTNVKAARAKESQKARTYRKTHPENMHKLDSRHDAKRRALKANAPIVENVDLDVVYKRDRGICQLHHGKIKRAQASRDHIIPLSKGGPHTYQNVVWACLECNAIKRDRELQQQMRLF